MIVSILGHRRRVPGHVPRPAGLEADRHVDRDAVLQDARIEILDRFDVVPPRELDEHHVLRPIDPQHGRVDFLQNAVEEIVVRQVSPVIRPPGIDPRLPLPLTGVVPLESGPHDREIVHPFARPGLTALQDALLELAVQRRFSTSRSAQ